MQGQLPPEAQETVEELQQLQQRAQQIAIQKQQAEAQLNESQNAIDALEDIEDDAAMYREVGELLVETNREDAQSELEELIDNLEIRVQTLEKQEDRVEDQFEDLQSDLQELLQGAGVGAGAGGQPGNLGPGGPGAGG